MEMKRKMYADGGLVNGQKYKDRLDRAIDGPAAAPATTGPAAMPAAPRTPTTNRTAGIENIGGVGVLSPPDGKLARNFQQDQMRSTGFLRRKEGGMVRGPGGPRDDKIPAMLSNGEYVLPADTVKKVGVAKLEGLRRRTHSFSKAGKAMK